eukprot:631756-Amphidinium_carterae.1
MLRFPQSIGQFCRDGFLDLCFLGRSLLLQTELKHGKGIRQLSSPESATNATEKCWELYSKSPQKALMNIIRHTGVWGFKFVSEYSSLKRPCANRRCFVDLSLGGYIESGSSIEIAVRMKWIKLWRSDNRREYNRRVSEIVEESWAAADALDDGDSCKQWIEVGFAIFPISPSLV